MAKVTMTPPSSIEKSFADISETTQQELIDLLEKKGVEDSTIQEVVNLVAKSYVSLFYRIWS